MPVEYNFANAFYMGCETWFNSNSRNINEIISIFLR